MKHGVIEYTDQGKPICHICGKAFNKLGTHVYYTHNMLMRDYKKKFGLDLIKGIMSRESTMLARRRVYENYDQCITVNLKEKGIPTRYETGSKGRTKEFVSEQTRLRLSHGKENK